MAVVGAGPHGEGLIKICGILVAVDQVDLFVAVTEDGSFMETREQGLARAQALIRKYIRAGVSLADELVAERRAEDRCQPGKRRC
jgi:hypothetical protein